MAHGIVRTDKMFGTVVATGTASAKYLPSSTATAIDNGCFVVLGGYVSGEREVRTATTPAADSALATLALVASEEIDKTKKFDTLADFTNAAGSVIRTYVLHAGDEFSITADAFETSITPTPGTSILEAQAGVKGLLVNSPTASSTKIADLVAVETDGPVTWYVFRV